MTSPKDELSRDDPLALVADLERQLADATVTTEELRREIADLKGGGKRLAAPFSKGTPATIPQKPGLKAGIGSFSSGVQGRSPPTLSSMIPSHYYCR